MLENKTLVLCDDTFDDTARLVVFCVLEMALVTKLVVMDSLCTVLITKVIGFGVTCATDMLLLIADLIVLDVILLVGFVVPGKVKATC